MAATERHTFVAFVRNVMVGREGLDRTTLTSMFDAAGATDAASHLATGNVSFVADAERIPAMTRFVEQELEHLLGRATPLFVRSLDQLRVLVESDPFAAAPISPVRDEIVTMFTDRVPPHLELPIEAPRGDFIVFGAGAAEVFSVTAAFPDRQPQAPGGRIERLAGEPVTSRALGTIERIVRLRAG